MVAGLLIRWWSAVRASLAMVVDLLLMHRLSVSSSFLPLVCLLLCHWSAVALSAGPSAGLVESWVRVSLVHRWSICSCIVGLSATLPVVCLLARHSSIRSGHVTRASARSSLVCLFGSWSLACSSVAGLLFVRRWPWSSICHSHIARASA